MRSPESLQRAVQKSGGKLRGTRYVRLATSLSPVEIFSRIAARSKFAYLLESEDTASRLAEFSFVGFDPSVTLAANGRDIEITRKSSVERLHAEDPLSVLRQILQSSRVNGARFRFAGGAVGYVSYEAVRFWERLPAVQSRRRDFPDLEFGIFEDGLIFDHSDGSSFYYTSAGDRYHFVKEVIGGESKPKKFVATVPRSNISQTSFERMVRKAKEYIASGDVFQAVLSRQLALRASGDLLPFYSALRKINPSPYMYFLKFGKRQIIGSSPEMLFRVENRTIETFPIAGTRPRTNDPGENERLKKELLASEKEKAEHLMLVDLARNDVGKVSRFGTVKTTEFMRVMEFSHVQHIVSRVVGELREGLDSFDAFRAIFPAGTVSGAPKPRSMEIIQELEPERRGPYAGAVGYFSNNGNSDFAIAIRTLFRNGKDCYIQTGAGIVADSEPAREWEETEAKAGALTEALRISSSGKK